MSFDVAASRRRLKPEKRTTPLTRRSDEALEFVTSETQGANVLLDTTVYIDALRGARPDAVRALLRNSRVQHSAVALAELTHALGRLDPEHANTAVTGNSIARMIAAIAEERMSAPSVRAFGEAGIVAGMVARLRGMAPAHAQALLNDALLFLQAAEQGAILLSRNIADLDLIQQLVPSGRVLFYRQTA